MKSVYLKLKKFADLMKKITDTATIVLLMVMTVVMFSQVVGRFVFGRSIVWSEEALRFMLIWLVFLGVSTAIHDHDLSRFEMLQEKLSSFWQKIIWTVVYLLMGLVLYFTNSGVLTLVSRQMAQRAVSIPIPMGIIYMVIPYFCILSLFYLALHIIALWANYPGLPSSSEEASEE